MSAAILGTGIVAPGAAGIASVKPALERPPTGDYRVTTIGDESNLRYRRLPRIDRMALAAAREALGSHDPSDVALVYATGYGGLTATVDFLEGVASRGPAFGSPTSFHQSVHHSAAGQISIALGMRGLSLTVSAREISGETALKVALDLIQGGRAEKVLVVAADEVVPTLVAAYRAFDALGDEGEPMRSGRRGIRPGEGAAAMLLAPAKSTDPQAVLADVLLAGHPVSGLRLATDARALTPLISRATEACRGRPPLLLAAATGTDAEAAEAEAIQSAAPEARIEHLATHFGFNPSAGLMRAVVASLRGTTPAVVHGLSLGGGQAAVVIRSDA